MLGHAAKIHHDHIIGDFGNDAQIMGDHHDRHAHFFLQLADQVENGGLGGNVERSCRLIGDQQLGAAAQTQRNHGALPHAAGKLERIGVKPILGAWDAHPAQRAAILMDMLHPDRLDRTGHVSDGMGICGWGVLPLTMVVGQHGVDDFDRSLALLREMTMRFSAEFGIRRRPARPRSDGKLRLGVVGENERKVEEPRPSHGGGDLYGDDVSVGDPPAIGRRNKNVGRPKSGLQHGPDQQLLVADQRSNPDTPNRDDRVGEEVRARAGRRAEQAQPRLPHRDRKPACARGTAPPHPAMTARA